MKHSNIGLGHGTKGNPQQDIGQQETKEKSLLLESNIKNKNRDEKINSVKTNKAKKIMSELYRPGAEIGDGGTADMLIDEANNGVQPGKKSHYQKATDRVREIDKVLEKNLAPGDEKVLESEKEKLIKAILLWESKHGKK
jgi:hypothetical protein